MTFRIRKIQDLNSILIRNFLTRIIFVPIFLPTKSYSVQGTTDINTHPYLLVLTLHSLSINYFTKLLTIAKIKHHQWGNFSFTRKKKLLHTRLATLKKSRIKVVKSSTWHLFGMTAQWIIRNWVRVYVWNKQKQVLFNSLQLCCDYYNIILLTASRRQHWQFSVILFFFCCL